MRGGVTQHTAPLKYSKYTLFADSVGRPPPSVNTSEIAHAPSPHAHDGSPHSDPGQRGERQALHVLGSGRHWKDRAASPRRNPRCVKGAVR